MGLSPHFEPCLFGGDQVATAAFLHRYDQL